MKKIALIILSPGHKDGSEVTEVISARLALSEFKVNTKYFSFDEKLGSDFNMLEESQRITRGETLAIQELNPDEFDALVLPGGSGVLKNLLNWNSDSQTFKVHPHFQEVVTQFHQQSKPIGAICISPFLVGRILQSFHPLITLGESSELIGQLERMNIQHESCPSNDYITDRDHKILSTPAYMNNDVTPFQVYTGIRLMLKELVEMA